MRASRPSTPRSSSSVATAASTRHRSNEFLELGVWDRYFTGEYEQAIRGLGGLAIWHKDVGYARQVARENDTALPLAAVVHEAYKATVRRVDENEGHAAALIEYWRALNDAESRDAR